MSSQLFLPAFLLLFLLIFAPVYSDDINYGITVPVNYGITLPVNPLQNPVFPVFTDVTAIVGLDANAKYKKYGSPAIADLDRDGYPDLLLCHHDSVRAELHFNNGNGTFSKSSWGRYDDNHGFVPFPSSSMSKGLRFILSVGGNYGKNLKAPLMYKVDPTNREVSEITKEAGITKRRGRGRSAVFLDLSMMKHSQWPDVIILNAKATFGDTEFAYENLGNDKFKQKTIKGSFQEHGNMYAMVTDLNNDGIMELITYWKLQVWKLIAPFHLEDITNDVLPSDMPRGGVVSVAEIDFNNDGVFDLYVARTKSGDLSWQSGDLFEDYLLENRNGKYYDVTTEAGIPRRTTPRGVTVGDFNNDGWMDIYVTQHREADIMLLNKGDGTFKSVSGLAYRSPSIRGDHSVAVDYDLDGRVDLISGQGDQFEQSHGGSFRIFRNVLENKIGGYILVRVGNTRDRNCTPLNAVITAILPDGIRMQRRVGSAGIAVSHSYLETQHFGIGSSKIVTKVYVKYTNGFIDLRKDVEAGKTVFFGVV